MNFNKMKEKSVILMLSVILVSIVVFNIRTKRIKNIIVMIPDGTSISHMTLSRWYNSGKKLAVDNIITGLVRTHWKDGIITDSAASGTAFSTGNRTDIGYVSVVSHKEGDFYYGKPVATIIEAAQKIGKSTGIVCTSNLNDATPATFSSHVINRKMWDIISEQQVYSNIDVLLGGGSEWYFSGNKKYNRKDGRILKDEIVNRGYDFVTTKEEMLKSKSDKLWGSFAPVELPIDDANVPTIKDMTKKSLEILSKNENGFFLLVEGSKVDWCSHYNDANGIIKEFLDFDKSVEEAIKFAKNRDDTVVIVCPDHGNGGLTIGVQDSDYYVKNLEILHSSMGRMDVETVLKLLNNDRSNIGYLLKEYCGIENLGKDEEERIKKSDDIKVEINRLISKRAGLGWTTKGHTGEDVFLACYHPNNEELRGVVDAVDVNKYIEGFFFVDLKELSNNLFVDASKEFLKKGYKVLKNDNELLVKKNKNVLRLPYNKDVAFFNNREIKLNGINVYTGEYLFVSKDTLDILEKN